MSAVGQTERRIRALELADALTARSMSASRLDAVSIAKLTVVVASRYDAFLSGETVDTSKPEEGDGE